jgi:hypothetical protein
MAGWTTAHFHGRKSRQWNQWTSPLATGFVVIWLAAFSAWAERKTSSDWAGEFKFDGGSIFTSWEESTGSKEDCRGREHIAGRETKSAPPSKAVVAGNPLRRACKAPFEKFLRTCAN